MAVTTGSARSTPRSLRETSQSRPVLFAGLALVVVGAGAVFDPWGWSGYLSVKVIAVGVGVALLALSLGRTGSLVVPWGAWGASAGVLGVLMVLATVLNGTVWRSVLGAPLRLEGMLAWLGFATAFVVGLSLRRRHGDVATDTLMQIAVIAVIVVGAVGIFELAGVEVDSDLIEFRGRVRSTLGNPAAFAGFVVLVAPLAAAASLRRDWWRWAGVGAACLSLIGIAVAQSRGAWLAAGAVAVGIAAVRLRGRLRWVSGAALLAAAAGSVLSGRWHDAVADLGERAAIWRVAVSTIADNPVLGVGPEGFGVAFGERVSDDTIREIGRAAVVDRAHSGILDFAVSFGGVAGLLLAVLLGAVGVAALTALRSGDWRLVALAAGVTAYGLQQQVLFAHPAVDTVWWLMIGFLVADTALAVRPMPRTAAVAAVAVAAALVVNSASVLRNDRLFKQALDAPSITEAYETLDRAASHRPFDDASYLLMGKLVGAAPDVSIVLRGVGRLSEGAERNRGNELVLLALADAQLQAHRLAGQPSFAADADRTLSSLIAQQPANGDAFLRRGIARYYLGDTDAARTDWQRAADLMPERAEPRDYLTAVDSDASGESDWP